MKVLALLAAMSSLMLFGQQFPEGEGRALTMDKCAGCHSLEEVWAHKDNEQGWAKLIAYMVSRGMVATEDERQIINQYLARSFPADEAGQKKGTK